MSTVEEQAKKACGFSSHESFHYPHIQRAWNCVCKEIIDALRERQEMCAKAVDSRKGGAPTTASIAIRSLK